MEIQVRNEVKDESMWKKIKDWCCEAETEETEAVKKRQINKFNDLRHNQFRKGLDPKKVVKNLSNRPLTEDEEQVLTLGLNFAVIPKTIPVDQYIAGTETTARQLDSKRANDLRTLVSRTLQTAVNPKCNLPSNLRRAVKQLKNDDSIVIVPADKGNATVVLNKNEYEDKLNAMLADETYKKLKKDPTSKVEKQISDALKDCEKEGSMTKECRLKLTPKASVPPQLYGLPKIHKVGVPLRPIVSTIGSPTYYLAKWLTKLLSPLVGGTSSNVKNSVHFVQMIRELTFDKNDWMVSFDVVSLFTRVPVDEALDEVAARLSQDDTLEERTSLSPSQLCHLTKLCLKSTYFQFRGEFFEQLEGAAMGSPLSPLIANLFMESLEKKALESSPQKPKIWLRYVDDTFVVWPHGTKTLLKFQQHLNKQHPNISFTMEEESERQIPFLDVMVNRIGPQAQTSVYRKPTHTDRYINYNSNHPKSVLRATLCSMRNRANKICSGETRKEEILHLKKVFGSNGYPRAFIQSAIKRIPHTDVKEEQTDKMKRGEEEREEEKPKMLYLPYVRGVSERIARKCGRIGVRPVFKSEHTLRRTLTHVKTAIPEEKKQGVVYEVPCRDCGAVYIGETGRNLQERVKEHKYAVKRQDDNNGIAVHAWTNDHAVDWSEAKVRTKEQVTWRRKILEAIHIQQEKRTTTNLDCGIQLNPIWSPLISGFEH